MSAPSSLVEQRLGRGVGFPVRPDSVRGDVQYRSGAAKVRQAIELILRTEPGERVMRPAFGCPLRQFLMEPNTVATRTRLERAVALLSASTKASAEPSTTSVLIDRPL